MKNKTQPPKTPDDEGFNIFISFLIIVCSITIAISVTRWAYERFYE